MCTYILAIAIYAVYNHISDLYMIIMHACAVSISTYIAIAIHMHSPIAEPADYLAND